MDPHTRGTEGPAADRGSALRIPQDSVARTGIVAVDALAGGTGGVTQDTREALAPYTNTTECVGALYCGNGGTVASFGNSSLGFAHVALGERSRHHEAGSGSPALPSSRLLLILPSSSSSEDSGELGTATPLRGLSEPSRRAATCRATRRSRAQVPRVLAPVPPGRSSRFPSRPCPLTPSVRSMVGRSAAQRAAWYTQ